MGLKRLLRRIRWKLESVSMPRFTLITAGLGIVALLFSVFVGSFVETDVLAAIIGWTGFSLFFASFLVIGVVTVIKKESIFTNAARQWGIHFFSRAIWAQIEGMIITVVALVGSVLALGALFMSLLDWVH